MQYSKNRLLKLLKRLQDLEKQGKFLYHENLEQYLELLEYQAMVEEHIFWEKRCQFFSLMENFMNGLIGAEEFCDILSVLNRETLNVSDEFITDFEKLKDFQPDFRSKGFGSFISFLRCKCESFEPDSTFVELNMVRENGDLTEAQLKDSIRDAMLQIFLIEFCSSTSFVFDSITAKLKSPFIKSIFS